MTRRLLLGLGATLLTAAGRIRAAEPWTAAELIEPKDLARRLAGPDPKPLLLHVGFPALYHSVHIPGSLYAGPAAKPEGMAKLGKAAGTDKSREIVLYCGCCPFEKCPNVRPAFAWLKQNGYSHVTVLEIPSNLHTDWIEKGYPVERAGA